MLDLENMSLQNSWNIFCSAFNKKKRKRPLHQTACRLPFEITQGRPPPLFRFLKKISARRRTF